MCPYALAQLQFYTYRHGGQLRGPESALNTQQGSTKYILMKKKNAFPYVQYNK